MQKRNLFLIFSIFAFNLFVIACDVEANISLKAFKVGSTFSYLGTTSIEGSMGIRKGSFPVSQETTIFGWRKISNQDVLVKTFLTNNQVSFAFEAQDEYGIYTFATQGPTDMEPKLVEGKDYSIKTPLKAGNSWKYSNDKGEDYTMTIIGEEEITVPAGNFKCYKIESVGKKEFNDEILSFEEYDWYNGNGYLIKLYLKMSRVISFEPTDIKILLQLSSSIIK